MREMLVKNLGFINTHLNDGTVYEEVERIDDWFNTINGEDLDTNTHRLYHNLNVLLYEYFKIN